MLRDKILFSIILLITGIVSIAQNHVSGFVVDRESGELLIGAYILELGTNNGTSTDNNGYFNIVTKDAQLQVSYIGYKKQVLQNVGMKDTLLIVRLSGGHDIEEVTIQGRYAKLFNVATLSTKEVLSIPSLGGKPDVLKALQQLPGIQTQTEGSSLIMVRGGSPGENLYLIDNTPLIYVNHLGGFSSVFNPDMINSIEVYKGGFPAKYGGKLSSIIALTQREGNGSKIKGNLGIGITDVSFCVEGPLKNRKATFILTGRKTMIDPLMILVGGLSSGGDYYAFYGFHDVNGKLSWKPNSKNNIYLNLYQGDDYIRYWSKGKTDKNSLSNIWANWLLSSRWNRVVSSRLYMDCTMSYTKYRYRVGQYYQVSIDKDTSNFSKVYTSSVQDLSLRMDWKYTIQRNWLLEFGAKATQLTHFPNEVQQSNLNDVPAEKIGAFESDLYFNNHLKLLDFVEMDLGIRVINYLTDGYNDFSLEPRLNVNIDLSSKQVINFNAQKVNQYAHLVLTSGTILSNEVWIPSNKQVAPGWSTQYSVGWKGVFLDGMFQTELDFYYKELNDLTTYREGYANMLGDGNWRNKIETGGSGSAKGAEILIKKTKGDWTGFVSYTLSKTTRQFPGINNGKVYDYDFDRPHSFSLNLNKILSEKWKFNAMWIYQLGLPYTPVLGRQLNLELNETLIYGERNSSRMRDYHRLDISFQYAKKTKKGRNSEWIFSVYNLYNRHNPNLYYYNTDNSYLMKESVNYKGEYNPLKLYQVSFFPVIPTVSYKIFFE